MQTELYAVCGSPIIHSRSPQLFERFFELEGREARYFRILSSDAASCLQLMQELDIKGMNATSPLKEELFSLLQDYDPMAKTVNAVNCLRSADDGICGYNTDIYSVLEEIQPLTRAGTSLRIVVLGAGAAARAAVAAVIELKCRVFVLNRSISRAAALAQSYDVQYDSILNVQNYTASCDVLINTIPDGTEGLELSALRPETVILDAIYAAPGLKAYAESRGLVYIPGTKWLFRQALASYTVFTGKILNAPEFDLTNEANPGPDPIFLIGFMGSGKTSVGHELAHRMKRQLIDMDSLLESRMGKSIAAIFAENGEQSFRALESELLQELQGRSGIVVSTGGGIVLTKKNRDILKKHLSVWIYRNIAHLYGRSAQNRPLLFNASPQQISGLFTLRKPLYAEACSFMIRNDDINACSAEIYDEIHHYSKR